MEDEIRVTVIATGFDEKYRKEHYDGKALHRGGEKVEQTAAAQKAEEETADAPQQPEPASVSSGDAEDDPFDAIFNIFNKRQ